MPGSPWPVLLKVKDTPITILELAVGFIVLNKFDRVHERVEEVLVFRRVCEFGDVKIHRHVPADYVTEDILLMDFLATKVLDHVFEHGYRASLINLNLLCRVSIFQGSLAKGSPFLPAQAFAVQRAVHWIEERREYPTLGVARLQPPSGKILAQI